MYSAANQQAQLCFGHVHHKRLRPTVHAFKYGVYFIRLPLRSLANDTFSSRWVSRNRFNLLSFHDKDHGDGKRPLLEWIDAQLKEEGIHDANGEILLQTFPRVLGYVFNPVSFWFCHREDGQLRAILCEVCNTFGERHYYLLASETALQYGEEYTARKIFHVSPFCAIEGSYRFRFMLKEKIVNQLLHEQTIACVDYDDENGPLLLTSISGESSPLSDTTALRAFIFYPLMTFGVIAKIHWQALQLWIKRVPFFRKPLPPSQELSR